MAGRLKLVDLPNWPRILSRSEAARYVGLSVGTFMAGVGDRWPQPIQLSATRIGWDRKQLDEAVDRLAGNSAPSALDVLRAGREARSHEGQREAH